MAIFLSVPFTSFLFENDDFLTFLVIKYGSFNTGRKIGFAYADLAVIFNQMYVFKGETIPFICRQLVDEDLLTFLDFKLLTSYGDYCKHVVNVLSKR